MPADFARITDPSRREHFVYRLYGKRGRLLYIGCSMNLERRLREHRRSFGERLAPRVKATGPYNYETARRIERAAIEAAQPPFNREWTEGHRRGISPFAPRRHQRTVA